MVKNGDVVKMSFFVPVSNQFQLAYVREVLYPTIADFIDLISDVLNIIDSEQTLDRIMEKECE